MKTILFFLFILAPLSCYSQINSPSRVKPIKVYSIPRGEDSKSEISANAQRYKRRVICERDKNIIIFMSEEYKDGKIVERKEGAPSNFGVRGYKNIVFEVLVDLRADKTIRTQMNCPGGSASNQYKPDTEDAVMKWKHYEVDTSTVGYNVKVPVLLYYEEKERASANENYLDRKFGNKNLPLSADAEMLKNIGHYFIYSYMIIPEEQ